MVLVDGAELLVKSLKAEGGWKGMQLVSPLSTTQSSQWCCRGRVFHDSAQLCLVFSKSRVPLSCKQAAPDPLFNLDFA